MSNFLYDFLVSASLHQFLARSSGHIHTDIYTHCPCRCTSWVWEQWIARSTCPKPLAGRRWRWFSSKPFSAIAATCCSLMLPVWLQNKYPIAQRPSKDKFLHSKKFICDKSLSSGASKRGCRSEGSEQPWTAGFGAGKHQDLRETMLGHSRGMLLLAFRL